MAKADEKAKKVKSPSIEDTTAINLNVPTKLYYEIKGKADKDTVKNKEKKTIHDRMVDDLYKANPSVKRD